MSKILFWFFLNTFYFFIVRTRLMLQPHTVHLPPLAHINKRLKLHSADAPAHPASAVGVITGLIMITGKDSCYRFILYFQIFSVKVAERQKKGCFFYVLSQLTQGCWFVRAGSLCLQSHFQRSTVPTPLQPHS